MRLHVNNNSSKNMKLLWHFTLMGHSGQLSLQNLMTDVRTDASCETRYQLISWIKNANIMKTFPRMKHSILMWLILPRALMVLRNMVCSPSTYTWLRLMYCCSIGLRRLFWVYSSTRWIRVLDRMSVLLLTSS